VRGGGVVGAAELEAVAVARQRARRVRVVAVLERPVVLERRLAAVPEVEAVVGVAPRAVAAQDRADRAAADVDAIGLA
jgi:hypothetical protein